MRRVAFFELPQAHLDLLLRASEDPSCEIAGVLARDASSLSLRLADLLGMPHRVSAGAEWPACDVLIAGDPRGLPGAPGLRVASAAAAAAGWERVLRGEAPAAAAPGAGEEPAPVRGWRRAAPAAPDALDVAALAFRPHALAAWILAQACLEAKTDAGALFALEGREGVLLDAPALRLSAEALAAWSALPRVRESFVAGAALALLDEELKHGDGRVAATAGVMVPFGDGGPFRGALLLRAGERFRTAELEWIESWCRRAGALLSQSAETWQAVRAARQRAGRDALAQAIAASTGAEAMEAAAGALAEAMGSARAGLWMESGGRLVGAGAGTQTWAAQVVATGKMRRYQLRDEPVEADEESWILVIPVASSARRGAAVLEDVQIPPDELDVTVEDTASLAAWAFEVIARRKE